MTFLTRCDVESPYFFLSGVSTQYGLRALLLEECSRTLFLGSILGVLLVLERVLLLRCVIVLSFFYVRDGHFSECLLSRRECLILQGLRVLSVLHRLVVVLLSFQVSHKCCVLVGGVRSLLLVVESRPFHHLVSTFRVFSSC